MNKIKLFGFVIAVVLGAVTVVYGGYDDSPGAQLLGLLIFIFGIVGIVRRVRKASK